MRTELKPKAWSPVRRLGMTTVQNNSIVAGVAPRTNRDPVAYEDWPLWAKCLALKRRATDAGLGDSVVHLIGDTRSEAFKRWFKKRIGADCGCAERQKWLNERFPYSTSP